MSSTTHCIPLARRGSYKVASSNELNPPKKKAPNYL